MLRTLRVNSAISIPRSELRFTFVRSSGPGGQNVNKVSSKAVMRWNVRASANLPDGIHRRFLARYASRIHEDGCLVITSQRYRDQGRNVADCLEKLRTLILGVATPPVRRRATRPTRAAVERRLKRKREDSRRKQERRTRPRLDD